MSWWHGINDAEDFFLVLILLAAAAAIIIISILYSFHSMNMGGKPIMPNTNCLEGTRCPNCGYEDAFYIDAHITVLVTDNGTEDNGGDYEWNGESSCCCKSCDYRGKLKEFDVENQPAKREETDA